MQSLNKLFILSGLIALTLVSTIGCTIAPKAEYSRTEIDRPYSLPRGVAKTGLGFTSHTTSLDHAYDSFTGKIVKETYVIPTLAFENGINDKLSWVFPLGLRWGVWRDKYNTFGISVYSALLYNELSLDYWYRLNTSWSLRPFFRASYLDVLVVFEKQNYSGAELLYQATDVWAFKFAGYSGRIEMKSELIDKIVTGISNDTNFTTETHGSFWGSKLGTVYSINDRWDVGSDIAIEKYNFGFSLTDTLIDLAFNYYW